MIAPEIQEKIYALVSELDKLSDPWAKAKAKKNYSDEIKKVTLNLSKSGSEAKTAAGKEQEAYSSEEYKKYLWKAFEVDVEFYQLDAQKNKVEIELDCMRSLLSFEKGQINRTT